MSSRLMKKYLDILLEAMSFNSLQDAGDDYSLGETQIWYWKENLGNEMMKGYDSLKIENKIPNVSNLSATHVLIGKIAETDPKKIYSLMQAESWSPQNQAEEMIDNLGVGHTSMTVGDIIISAKKVLMVDTKGFVDLTTGEST